MRTIITPGRLYAKMSTEFRQICCAKCARCVLPIPERTRGGDWNVGELSTECQDCARVIADIVRRHQAEYDLLDPFTPLQSTPMPMPQYRPTRH
jgi:hypothetical protein